MTCCARLLASCALFVAVGASSAASQTPAGAPSAAEYAAKLPFDPLVTVGTLDNGLRYFIMRNPYPENRAELRLAVSVGSVFEDADQRGLAHFAEHMAFNGTKSFPKNDLVHYLQSIGSRFGADVNAYTSFDETVYMLQVPTDTGKFLERGFDILNDWAHGVTYDSTEIEAERGVVTEEWRLRRGAGARMQDQQFPVLTRGSRYADRMIIGTVENLQSFPHETLRRFYRDWYRPDMMAVVAVGDFDQAEVEKMIRARFSGLKRREPMARPVYPIPEHDSVYVTIATDPEATNHSFVIYSMLPRRDHSTLAAFRDRYIERLGLSMLNARMQELVQRPDAPFAFAAATRGYFVGSADSYSMFGGVKEGGILRGFEAVLTEAERAMRFGFTQSEFTRAKAQAIQSQEQLFKELTKRPSAARAAELLRHFLQGEEVLGSAGEYQAYQRLNPVITLDEVNRATKALLEGKNQVITVSAPDKAGVKVPTEAELHAVRLAVKTKSLEPYRDNAVSGPLLAKLPAPAAITTESTIPEVGITEWTLANGVRVVLKPTDYMNDQVVLSGFSPGGTSLVPDSLFVSASYATTVAGAGGLGEYNAIDLRKLLTGKTASANVSIGERTENVFGNSSANDIETMLQLVYLRFTAPRRDSTAFVAFRQSMQASMSNANASPQKAFFDTLSVTRAQHHFRARPFGPELLDEIDLDRALAVYWDRFADASDFTFVIVGNFALDSIKPLVQRYLGGLPSSGRQEVGRDVGIRPPTGRVERVVRKGVEPQSQTMMMFTGPFTYSPEESYIMSALGEVLSNRLIDNLREKLGGTYSVNANVSGGRTDPQLFNAVVQFGSAPDRAAELTAAVLAEIAALAATGPTAAELEKVREGQLRGRETAIKTNFFWSAQLGTAYQYGDDPKAILEYGKLVEGLTADAIRNAARRYLSTENYIHVTLLPQTVTP
ncbi:MAG: insulinase family protein [Gemmatimonadales bacterium]